MKTAITPALTVKNPWAWAIAAGHKTIENRSRSIKHRGPLAIHAGLAWSKEGGLDPRVLKEFWPFLTEAQRDRYPVLDPAEHRDRIVFGAVLATVNLVDCHYDDGCCAPWGDQDAWHWVLADVVKLPEPIPASGRLGLWHIELPAGVS